MIPLDCIRCGDSLKLMRELPDECVDLVFSDPPYWLRTSGGPLTRVEGTAYDGCDEHWDDFKGDDDYAAFTRAWLTECRRILKKDGAIWVIGGMQCIYAIGAIMQELGFWFINDVIWHKKNPTPNFLGSRLNNSHETLLWATKSPKARFTFHYKTAKELNTDSVDPAAYRKGVRKQLGSVWRIGVCQGAERLKTPDGKKLHATQKPEALLRRILTISTDPGDIVFDPFGGTFTTAAVAKSMGRHYISFDNDPVYTAAGEARLNAVKPELGDMERATFDRKPPRVKIAELIDAGYLKEGESLYLRDGTGGAILHRSGKVDYADACMSMHEAVALAKGVKAKRLNGFDHWFVLREQTLVRLGDVRSQYIADTLPAADLSPDCPPLFVNALGEIK